MMSMVLARWAGLERLALESLERHMHSLAGAALMPCGVGILVLGL
jgi:hypothetical protein